MRKYVLLLGLLALVGCAQVDSGTVGVKTRFGKVIGDGLEPGLHGINPFFEHVHEMSTQTMAHVVEATAVSKDMQEVTTQVTVNYSMSGLYAGDVFTKYRRDFEARVLAPTVQEAVKTATAQYNVEDLVNQRPAVKVYIFETLGARVAPTHVVEAVMLTDFAFSDVFSNAIEAKVTATQKALEAKNDLETAKFKAAGRIAQAQGEAEAIRIQAQAITQQGGDDYVRLKWIEAWGSGKAQVPQVIGADNTMFMLDMTKGNK